MSYFLTVPKDVIEAESEENHYADIDLQNALDVLQDKDRIVMILKYFEDKKLEEIADIPGENVNAIKELLTNNSSI